MIVIPFFFIKFNGKKKVINDEETRSFERKMLIALTTAVTWYVLRLKTKKTVTKTMCERGVRIQVLKLHKAHIQQKRIK